jgi:AbrB family looped-hinge helix DNA binding protein
MQAVKVLPKGQITLPKTVRKKLGIKEGDSLVLEEEKGRIVLKKGKTIFDYIGVLPNLGMSIEEMREKAIKEVAKERAESIHRHKRNT